MNNHKGRTHLKNKGYSNYSHKEAVFRHSAEDIDFIRLSSIELVEYLKILMDRRFIICNKNKRPSTSYINWYVNLRSSGSRSHVNYCNPLVHSTLIPRTHSLFFFKFCTYLAEDKRIEYHGILHIHGMLPGVIVQPKYTNALEVENQKDSNLIQSLRRVKDK